eukprot:Phypoly_transcript_13552.p1 GENE.Phypoly_transcript_13552~~Phypoly_transcript_13552.p1  ORF type:complete len:277 (+),score=41.95 Phypoly_transcript_13552:91-921(+)
MWYLAFILSLCACLVHTQGIPPSCKITNSKFAVANNTVVPGSDDTAFNNGDFIIVNNLWGIVGEVQNFSQGIYACEGGQWGFNWTRGWSQPFWKITYPEAVFGCSPFTTQPTTNNMFPVQVNNITSLTANMNISFYADDQEGTAGYDFSYDMFLTIEEPGQGKEVNITDEIMVFFHWSKATYVPPSGPVQLNAVNDGYNSYDLYWNNDDAGWRYHQFRISGAQQIPPKIDFKPFFVYIQKSFNATGAWLAGLEIGAETQAGSSGQAFVESLVYTLN